MASSKLEPLLTSMSQSTIKSMNINVPGEVISLDIKKENLDSSSEYSIVFEEVFSFYYVNEEGTIVEKPYIDSTKLSSIGYYKDGVGEFINTDVENDEDLSENDISLPNFAIEMLNSSIFIEARSIKINDKKFKVGYPSI